MNIRTVAMAVLLGSMSSVAWGSCPAVPGAAQLWSNTGIRWVWIGEMHGTRETPRAFGDLVCDALGHGRQVTVALERHASEQVALNALLSDRNVADAKEVLLRMPTWQQGASGLSSQAMLVLLMKLREFKQRYPSLRVVAIDGPVDFSKAGARDELLGQNALALAGSKPADLVLVLTGNVHGMKSMFAGNKTAAMYLPPESLISLQATDRGGEAWNYRDKGCGIYQGGLADRDPTRPFGVYLDPSFGRSGKVDGILALGEPITASPPADQLHTEQEACYKTYKEQHRNDTP